MIQLKNISELPPYNVFLKYYYKALKKEESNIEAIAISSFNKKSNYVDSRYVNLKSIEGDKWIFFTNYDSPKAIQFASHGQIAGLFFWKTINVQIRLKADIGFVSKEYSDNYFKERSLKKNALAISSEQSEIIDSYESVLEKYNEVLENKNLKLRPKHWGGYFFCPYEFEFWEGHESRLNKRLVFKKIDTKWEKFIIQP